MLKSTPTPETNPEETNHTVSDNETDANLGQPEAPSKSVERVVGGTTEDGGLRRRRVGRGGVTGGLGGLGGTGGSGGYVGGVGGSGGYGEGPRLRVGSWTLEDSTLLSQVTGSMDGEGGTGREESALFSQILAASAVKAVKAAPVVKVAPGEEVKRQIF
ncbi:hypothetical protein B0H14DRAFT_1172338 [Mycena olivaceomarginata]|nr:hypothetical protein B0H14DRAFT_1172338 [Mycena olivaceomarginata]